MEKDQLSARIGMRLRVYRQQRKLSLEALAQQTGVSKPMLGQIERGTSNPTVATLWKIAAGLNVPFAAFVAEESQVKLTTHDEQDVFYEDENRFIAYSTYAVSGSPVEMYRIRLLQGCCRRAEPHPPGVVESMTVAVGQVRIVVGRQSYVLSEGDALNFAGDISHTYENPFEKPAELHMIVVYGSGA
jgi:transcriptional regulator with XRE-family HTH domain